MTDVWSPPRLLPIGSQLGSLARRTVHRCRMGHTHLLDRARAWPYEDQQHTPSLTWSAMLAGRAQGKRKTWLPRRTFSTFGFFLFLPSITPAPPWSIKGRVGHPTKGTDQFQTKYDGSIPQHAVKQQSSSWRPFDPFTRDLRPVPLSSVCTPYYELFSVLITQAAADWT